jgi:hypothetical protein
MTVVVVVMIVVLVLVPMGVMRLMNMLGLRSGPRGRGRSGRHRSGGSGF